jgi:hypothetical protein
VQTKAFGRFLNRAAHFDADLEVVDIVKRANDREMLHSPGCQFLFDDVSQTNHPTLATRHSSSKGRQIAINHLRATVYASYIKDLYEDAMAYFSELLNVAARNGIDPKRFVGEHKLEFDAVELLGAKSWGAVVRLVSDKLFRALENTRDTKKVVEKMNSKLGLCADRAKIRKALPYLMMRHVLVHSDGVVDEEFVVAYPEFGLTKCTKVELNINLARTARQAITELVKEFDRRAVAAGIIGASDCQPK